MPLDPAELTCPLCGLVIRDSDHVLEIGSLEPPVVHVGCAEAAHLPDHEWDHTDIRTLNEWSRGMGWAGSA